MEIDVSFDDRDGGCGCLVFSVFVLGGFALLGLVFVLAHLHQIKVAVGVAIGVLSCAVLAREGLRRLPARKPAAVALGALPTPLANVKPGLASVAGLVGFTEAPRNAPLGAPPCVFYRVLVTKFDEPDQIIFEGRSADAITLDDGAGAKVVVQLDGARWRGTRQHVRESTLIDTSDDVARFLSERGIVVSGAAHVRVEWIAPHELVFVRGLVRRIGEDGPSDYRTTHESHFEMAATPEHPLEIGLEPLVS